MPCWLQYAYTNAVKCSFWEATCYEAVQVNPFTLYCGLLYRTVSAAEDKNRIASALPVPHRASHALAEMVHYNTLMETRAVPGSQRCLVHSHKFCATHVNIHLGSMLLI